MIGYQEQMSGLFFVHFFPLKDNKCIGNEHIFYPPWTSFMFDAGIEFGMNQWILQLVVPNSPGRIQDLPGQIPYPIMFQIRDFPWQQHRFLLPDKVEEARSTTCAPFLTIMKSALFSQSYHHWVHVKYN